MAKRNGWMAVIFLVVFMVGCVSAVFGFSLRTLDTSSLNLPLNSVFSPLPSWANGTFKVPRWSNDTLKAEFKIIQGTIHFSYRYGESGGMYRYLIKISSSCLYLGKQTKNKCYVLAKTALLLDGGWHEIEIRGYKDTLNIHIDEALLISYKDDNPIRRGSITFKTLGEWQEGSEFFIGDIKIRKTRSSDMEKSKPFFIFGTSSKSLKSGISTKSSILESSFLPQGLQPTRIDNIVITGRRFHFNDEKHSKVENTIDDILRSQQQEASGISLLSKSIAKRSGIPKITGDIGDILRGLLQQQDQRRRSDEETRGTWQAQFQIGGTTHTITYYNTTYAMFQRGQQMDKIRIQMEQSIRSNQEHQIRMLRDVQRQQMDQIHNPSYNYNLPENNWTPPGYTRDDW